MQRNTNLLSAKLDDHAFSESVISFFRTSTLIALGDINNKVAAEKKSCAVIQTRYKSR